ncbi:unnamed protein product [Parnassius mnemosyne]|uniref:Uncharacterized protein n=1 Tax=Parnassius mnemosyne TaxID=213953 RepID=A0AAV1M2K3_9NEOP
MKSLPRYGYGHLLFLLLKTLIPLSKISKWARALKRETRKKVIFTDGKTNQNLDNKYVHMIAVDMEPLRKGKHEGFRDFLNALDSRYEIPDTTILNIITEFNTEYYENVKQKLVLALSKAEHVSLTTDLWTSIANEGILSVTCHFFHNEKLIAPLLEVVKMEESHNAENIASGSVDKRLSPYENRTLVVLVTILDPRFKTKGSKTSDNEKRADQWLEKAYVSQLTKECLSVEETQPTPSTSSGTCTDLLRFLHVNTYRPL